MSFMTTKKTSKSASSGHSATLSPRANQRHIRRSARAVRAMQDTALRERFVSIARVIEPLGMSLDEWFERQHQSGKPLRQTDTTLQSNLAYSYGYILGIADAFRVPVPLLIATFAQTCDECGRWADRLMPIIERARTGGDNVPTVNLCRSCLIMRSK